MKVIIRIVTGLVFIVGVVFLIQLTRENGRLADDVSQLEAEVGRLPITDINRVHIVAIKAPRVPPEVASHVDRVWQYRIYLPANYDYLRMRGGGRVAEDGVYLEGGHSTGWSAPKAEATNTLMSLSLGKGSDRASGVYSIYESGGAASWGRFGPDQILNEELVVQTLASLSQGARSFDQETILPLLKVYDPSTAEQKKIGDTEITTYQGGLVVLAPKSRQSELEQLQRGRVPKGFTKSWIAKAVSNE